MDSKDFQLLAALHENARQSYQSLGRRVSLSAPVVRDRLRRLEKRGILQGFWLTPDPSVFDRQELLLLFQGEWTHEDAKKVVAAPDVAWVAWKLDGGLTVQVWPYDNRQAVRNLTRLLGKPPSTQTLSDPGHHPQLSLLDWTIMDTLVDDPRMALDDICNSTGLSPKTVRKHLQMLTEERIIFITPRLGALADSGEIVFTLAVFGKISPGEVRKIMGEDASALINQTQTPPTKYLLCRGSDLGDVTTKTNILNRQPGVEAAYVTLNREILIDYDFIHSLLREKNQKLEKRPRSGTR